MTPFPQTELREIEQYFFSENVIHNIVEALDYENNIICLGTPAVADGFYKFKNRKWTCMIFAWMKFACGLGTKTRDVVAMENHVVCTSNSFIFECSMH